MQEIVDKLKELECGWKHGDSGHSAGRTNVVSRNEKRIDLTPTGLLMEGDSASVRFLFAFFVVSMSEIEIFRQP